MNWSKSKHILMFRLIHFHIEPSKCYDNAIVKNNHFNLQPKQAKNLDTVEKYDIILLFSFSKN